MPFSWLDIILLAIMLVSGLLAMLRGLTREVLSILSWAAAALAALRFDVAGFGKRPPFFQGRGVVAGVVGLETGGKVR